LVSQVITQRGCHKHNARALVERLSERGEQGSFLLLLGGPRIDHKLALSLGFDAGFGPGTMPRHVAAFIVERLSQKRGLSCSA
jgi:beta-lysine 5,6-aminomutase beta subunit